MRALLLACTMACWAGCAAAAEPAGEVADPGAEATRRGNGLGLRIEKAINRRDRAALAALVNPRAMAERAWQGESLSPLQARALQAGVARGLGQATATVIDTVERERGHARLLKTVPGDSHDSHLVRIVFHDENGDIAGLEYLHLLEGDDGLVHDWFSHAQGEWVAGRARTMLATLSGTGNVVQEALGLRSFDPDVQRALDRFSGQMLAGEAARAYQSLESMPEAFRLTRTWASLRATVASGLEPETWRAALRHLEQGFGKADDLQFHLLDLHVLEGDHGRALAAIRVFERRTVEDGHTNRIKCSLAAESGDLDAAVGHCRRSLALEPDVPDTWWELAAVGIRRQDPALVLSALEGLEQRFGMDFDPAELVRLDAYRWLKGTSEFKRWAVPRRLRHAR